jgi:hypothetical protein
MDNGNIIGIFVSGGDNPGCGPRKADQVIDPKLALPVNQQDRDGANFLNGKIGENKFIPIGKLNQHPIQGTDAQIHHAYGEPVGFFTRLPIGKTRFPIHKGLFIRVNIRSPVKEIPECKAGPPPKPVVFFSVLFFVRRKSFKNPRHVSLHADEELYQGKAEIDFPLQSFAAD